MRAAFPAVSIYMKIIRFLIMAGLRPGHPRLSYLGAAKTWMPDTRRA
jgi:hypothetical protein